MADRIAKVRLPDGRVARFTVPEGTSPQDVLTFAENYLGKGLTTSHVETMGESMAKAGESMGPKALIAGAGTRLNEAALRVKQILGFDLTPQEKADVEAGRSATGLAAAGRVAGDIAMGAPVVPASLPGAIAAGAAQSFLTNPLLGSESGVQNAIAGGAGGGAGNLAMRALGGVFRPITPSDDVQALLREGIVPTIGEAAASGGGRIGQMVNRLEESATSLPGAGQVISGARRRAGVEELNRAVFARATPAGIQPTQMTGRVGLQETYDAISGRYDEALTRIGVIRDPNNTFAPDMQRRVGQAVTGLTQDRIQEVQGIIQNIIGGRQSPVAGAYTADIAKQVDSELGARIRDFRNSAGNDNRLMANAIQAAQGAWRDLIRRNAPDQATRDMLDDANRAFANYIRAERAVGKSAAEHGEFNATQLNQAVRETSAGGARRSEYARGNALMEDLSDPAKAVLSTRLGESGTVPRALLAGGIMGAAGGGAAYNEQAGGPGALTGVLAAAAASPLLYSRAFSRYALGDLFPGMQNTLADLAAASVPYAGLAGRAINSRDEQIQLPPLRVTSTYGVRG